MRQVDITDLEALSRAADESGLARLLGLELVEVGHGFAKARLRVTEMHTNFFGMTHGAILYALADHVGSVAGNTLSRRAIMSQSTAYFFGNPEVGSEIFAQGRITQAGRTLGLMEAEVTDSDGRRLVSFNAGVYFLDREPVS